MEDSFGLSWEEVWKEAKRCLNCGCLAVNPSDVAAVLTAMDTEIVTNKRTEKIESMLLNSGCKFVDEGEIVTKVKVPAFIKDYKVGYDKFRVRESHDFAVVSVAAAYKIKDGVIEDSRLVLGAVAPVPFRVRKAENFINVKKITPELAEKAAEIALEDATPLSRNEYKIQIAKTLVRNSLLNAK